MLLILFHIHRLTSLRIQSVSRPYNYDLFITTTTNPNWSEIKDGQEPHDLAMLGMETTSMIV